MTPTVDFLGRTIEAGHVVVYPVRRKSDLRLHKLTVTEVSSDHIVGYSSHTGNLLSIKNLQNVVIVGGQPNGQPTA
jgi:hypothetical protein